MTMTSFRYEKPGTAQPHVRKAARAAILAALALCCLAPAAQAVPKWVFPLTVNGYAGASALADFPAPVTASSAPAMLDTRTRATLAPAVLTALDTRSYTEAWSIRPVYATQTTPVPVPYAWLDGYEGLVAGGDYEAAAHATAANGVNKVWECYVLGLNPTAASDFFLVDIAVAEGNAVISWSPDLGASRVYTIEAADTLDAPVWTEVESTAPTAGHPRRFFRVKAALP